MHDHHGNLIDFHTQLSTVVEATEFGPAGSRSQTEVAMKFWTLKAMMIVGCAKRSRARPHICRRHESQCRFGDTAQAADNWDKFRPNQPVMPMAVSLSEAPGDGQIFHPRRL